MSFLATTRSMFSFVLVLYLFGFATMISRWMAVEQIVFEDEYEPLRERRGAVESISLLNINAQDLPTFAQQDESLLKIDHDIPILKKDIAIESKESSQESKVKVPPPKTKKKSATPVQTSGKKPLKEKTAVKAKAKKGSLPAQKAVEDDRAKKGVIVAKKQTKEKLTPPKGNVLQKKGDGKGMLPTQKTVINDNAKKGAVVAKKQTKENLIQQKENVPQRKLDQAEAKVAPERK
ncbi:hepatoma-derived growth factor-related protein 2-like, partial [Asterias rubens]|uniref:hepatoma-derived growth factor-related protein 2-like n=1 Tax=Asterias rubens TaxID=7604 RepID=UPI0014558018